MVEKQFSHVMFENIYQQQLVDILVERSRQELSQIGYEILSLMKPETTEINKSVENMLELRE